MGGAKRYHLFSGSSRRQSSLNKKQRLRFKRGAPVDSVGATRPPLRCVYGYDQRLDVFGSGGMLVAGNGHATTVPSFGAASTGAADVVLPFFIERCAEANAAEIADFVECVRSGATP